MRNHPPSSCVWSDELLLQWLENAQLPLLLWLSCVTCVLLCQVVLLQGRWFSRRAFCKWQSAKFSFPQHRANPCPQQFTAHSSCPSQEEPRAEEKAAAGSGYPGTGHPGRETLLIWVWQTSFCFLGNRDLFIFFPLFLRVNRWLCIKSTQSLVTAECLQNESSWQPGCSNVVTL